MSKKNYIANLAPNQLVQGVFTIQNCQLGLTRNNKKFIKCLLADRTGRLPARMWNANEELYRTLPTDGFVYIEGQTQPYQGELQIIIQMINLAEPSPNDLLDLLPSTDRDIDDMFEQVFRIMDTLKNPSLRHLIDAYRKDSVMMENFRRAPAAMQLHHAYLGGLLEHTLNLLRLAESVLPQYPQVNRELVLMGLFLHDLGKCEELTWEAGFSYSDDGQLVGHIARGVVWLNDKARWCGEQGNPIPRPILRMLEHLILSHHGQIEFGAVKLPATPEAILINLLDNIDAKMQMSISAVRDEETAKSVELGGNFTEKMWALGTRLYRPDVLAGGDEPDDTGAVPAADSPPTRGGLE